jgi:ribosomal-protein-alanine N-acetyltransferase
VELKTARLLMRSWCDEDLAPFAAMNADPQVMEHFVAPLFRVESDNMVARLQAHDNLHGFTFWAAETLDTRTFIGMIGLYHTPFEAHFTPCVEIGWRLAFDHWHRGYATEGAQAALAFGFGELGLDEIVALTVPGNVRSRAVMDRLGMRCDPDDDFDHPMIPVGHPLRRHKLYRLGPERWNQRQGR